MPDYVPPLLLTPLPPTPHRNLCVCVSVYPTVNSTSSSLYLYPTVTSTSSICSLYPMVTSASLCLYPMVTSTSSIHSLYPTVTSCIIYFSIQWSPMHHPFSPSLNPTVTNASTIATLSLFSLSNPMVTNNECIHPLSLSGGYQ